MKIEMYLSPHDRAIFERIAVALEKDGTALEGISKTLDTNLPVIVEELKSETPPAIVGIELERGTPTTH